MSLRPLPQAAPDLPGTERASDAATDLPALSTRDLLELINSQDASVASAVRRELLAVGDAVDAVVERLRQGGRLILLGAGTSGRLAVMEAAEARPTFGMPATTVVGLMAGGPSAMTGSREGAEDDVEAAVEDIERLGLTARDTVVGVSASGRTPFVIAAVRAARHQGALTIGLSCDDPAPLSEAVDIAIHPTVGPEVIAGSTRLKAGTAQKLVLNMLTTAVMIRLGRIHGNLMIDVQATNAKLRDRARRIVEEVTGRAGLAVEEALAESGWSARVAIVMLRRDVDASEARRLIADGPPFSELVGAAPAESDHG
nr:N-acetylmuramic acid 6-phosphate etherase [Chloroflexota bacterium]